MISPFTNVCAAVLLLVTASGVDGFFPRGSSLDKGPLEKRYPPSSGCPTNDICPRYDGRTIYAEGFGYKVICNYDFAHGDNHLGTSYPVTLTQCIEECSSFNQGMFDHGQPGSKEKCAGVNFYYDTCYLKNNTLGGVPNAGYCSDSAILIALPPVSSSTRMHRSTGTGYPADCGYEYHPSGSGRPFYPTGSEYHPTGSGYYTIGTECPYYPTGSGTAPPYHSSGIRALSTGTRPFYRTTNSTFIRRPPQTMPPYPTSSNSTTIGPKSHPSLSFRPTGPSSFRPSGSMRPPSLISNSTSSIRPSKTVPPYLIPSNSTTSGLISYPNSYSGPTGTSSLRPTGFTSPLYLMRNSTSASLTSHPSASSKPTGASVHLLTGSAGPLYPISNSTLIYRPTGIEAYHALRRSSHTTSQTTTSHLTSDSAAIFPEFTPWISSNTRKVSSSTSHISSTTDSAITGGGDSSSTQSRSPSFKTSTTNFAALPVSTIIFEAHPIKYANIRPWPSEKPRYVGHGGFATTICEKAASFEFSHGQLFSSLGGLIAAPAGAHSEPFIPVQSGQVNSTFAMAGQILDWKHPDFVNGEAKFYHLESSLILAVFDAKAPIRGARVNLVPCPVCQPSISPSIRGSNTASSASTIATSITIANKGNSAVASSTVQSQMPEPSTLNVNTIQINNTSVKGPTRTSYVVRPTINININATITVTSTCPTCPPVAPGLPAPNTNLIVTAACPFGFFCPKSTVAQSVTGQTENLTVTSICPTCASVIVIPTTTVWTGLVDPTSVPSVPGHIHKTFNWIGMSTAAPAVFTPIKLGSSVVTSPVETSVVTTSVIVKCTSCPRPTTLTSRKFVIISSPVSTLTSIAVESTPSSRPDTSLTSSSLSRASFSGPITADFIIRTTPTALASSLTSKVLESASIAAGSLGALVSPIKESSSVGVASFESAVPAGVFTAASKVTPSFSSVGESSQATATESSERLASGFSSHLSLPAAPLTPPVFPSSSVKKIDAAVASSAGEDSASLSIGEPASSTHASASSTASKGVSSAPGARSLPASKVASTTLQHISTFTNQVPTAATTGEENSAAGNGAGVSASRSPAPCTISGLPGNLAPSGNNGVSSAAASSLSSVINGIASAAGNVASSTNSNAESVTGNAISSASKKAANPAAGTASFSTSSAAASANQSPGSQPNQAAPAAVTHTNSPASIEGAAATLTSTLTRSSHTSQNATLTLPSLFEGKAGRDFKRSGVAAIVGVVVGVMCLL